MQGLDHVRLSPWGLAIRHGQAENPFLRDPRGRLTTHLDTVPVGENPLALFGIEHDADRLACMHDPHVMVAIVQRHLTFFVHYSRDGVQGQMSEHTIHAPLFALPHQTVELTGVCQLGKNLPTALPLAVGVGFALQAVHLVETALQFGRRRTRMGFRPTLARPLRAFDDAVALRRARGIPDHVDAQADEPQPQVRGQVAPRTPGSAVVDTQALGQSPAAKKATNGLLHRPAFDLSPTAEGGKPPSSGQRHCTHPRSGATI